MKKLIGLFMVLFITTGVFGQKFICDPSFIESTGVNTVEDAIHMWNVTDGEYDWIKCVHFVKNDRLYLLAYEPNEIFSGSKRIPSGSGRDIYLYSKDINDINSPWKIASNCIMTNNWVNIRTYDEVDFFRSEKSRGSKGKVVIYDTHIKITIGYEVMSNGRMQASKPITFIFKPEGENFKCYAKSSYL